MVIIAFIIGYLVCFAHFYLVSERRYNILQADFRHLINEFSIRTGGRKVFREEKLGPSSSVEGGSDKYSILLPSIAEEEAEERDERESTSDLSDADMEHLRRMKVI